MFYSLKNKNFTYLRSLKKFSTISNNLYDYMHQIKPKVIKNLNSVICNDSNILYKKFIHNKNLIKIKYIFANVEKMKKLILNAESFPFKLRFKKKIRKSLRNTMKNVQTCFLKKKKSKFLQYPGKIPLNFNYLNFSQSSLVSLNRDKHFNPFFGAIRRGFPQSLIRIGIKEFKNIFLLPRWYRLQKLQAFKRYLVFLDKRREFVLTCIFDYRFFVSILEKKNIDFILQYIIRKRWLLPNILI